MTHTAPLTESQYEFRMIIGLRFFLSQYVNLVSAGVFQEFILSSSKAFKTFPFKMSCVKYWTSAFYPDDRSSGCKTDSTSSGVSDIITFL